MEAKKKQYVLRSGDLRVETADSVHCDKRFIDEELAPMGLVFDCLEDALYASTLTRAFLLALASTRCTLSRNKLSRIRESGSLLHLLKQKIHGQTPISLGLLQRRIEENVLDRIHALSPDDRQRKRP